LWSPRPCYHQNIEAETVTLEALLTFFGILVAVLAIARPVQRHSLKLFVPAWRMPAAILLSFALIICRDAPFGVSPPFGWSLSKVMFSLTVAAFAVPVLAALWGWASWDRGKLTARGITRVENIFTAALREREFDEVERIVRKNQERLDQLPAGAASVLFSPAMVASLVASHSLVHLELLADVRFLRSLEDRLGAVEVVVRELLRSDISPLRSAVVLRYGGVEHLTYSDSERALVEQTFQKPEWYSETNAHYPLTMAALEPLRTGELDSVYNDVGRHYEASQGISTRSRCPVYLASKTQVIAIETALEKRVEKDFYVTDLWDIFRAVLERSKFNEAVWQSPLSNHEFPTPYAYLLYQIAGDLSDLSGKALQAATPTDSCLAAEPGQIARALAMTWSYCVWRIAASQDQVSPEFRNGVIREYMLFVLALGWQPSEIYLGPGVDAVEGLDVWRDLFLTELQARFMGGNSAERTALKDALESLDQGKRHVYEGSDWIEEKLFGGQSI
jgi:hypothetical protein